jgi:hypothetical protein
MVACQADQEVEDHRGATASSTSAAAESSDSKSGTTANDSVIKTTEDDGTSADADAKTSETADGLAVELFWTPNTESDLQYYSIYAWDEAEGNASAMQVAKVMLTDTGFDKTSPGHKLASATDTFLDDLVGKKACFAITAGSASAESDKSAPKCLDL